MVSDGTYLTGLYFENQKYFDFSIERYEEKYIDVFNMTKKWLDLYFNDQIPDFIPPIKLDTTSFRKQVYDILLTIPYGHTVTYKEISNIIRKQNNIEHMSCQAVGGAVGHNPISIIIPCHRVMGTNNKLTGYAAGIDKKYQLLMIEKNKDTLI